MSTFKEFLKTAIGERIEQTDLDWASRLGQRKLLETVMSDFVAGDATTSQGHPQHMVMDGFIASAAGTVITVTGGKAIMGLRDSGVAEYGMLVSSGALSRTRDINSFSNATYGVYVRAEFQDSRIVNRLFWNPLASTPVETPKAVPTRQSENWTMAVELVAPGPEWMLVATALKSGGTVTITDVRTLCFDSLDGTIPNGEWGTSNDRNANRSTYGIKNLHRAFMALYKQLIGIIGGTTWMADPQAGDANGSGARSLTQLNAEKLARNGSQTLTGTILPSGSGTLDLGSTGARWRNAFLDALNLGGDVASTVAGSQTVNLSGGASSPGRTSITSNPTGASNGNGIISLHAEEAALAGTNRNFLAPACAGQNGLVHCTFSFVFPVIAPGVPAFIDVTLTHSGAPITTSDFILALAFSGGVTPDPYIVTLDTLPWVSSADTMRLIFSNWNDTASTVSATFTGTVLVLRS